MLTINIHIPDFKDVIRLVRGLFRFILFIFSSPKHKIGDTFVAWERKLTIRTIKRNWEYDVWFYEASDDIYYSEKLIDFYLKKENHNVQN
jgi:hypothetical protein